MCRCRPSPHGSPDSGQCRPIWPRTWPSIKCAWLCSSFRSWSISTPMIARADLVRASPDCRSGVPCGDMSSVRIVVMGVAGSGKTTVGRGLAHALGADFLDADSVHPPANVAKMSAGEPLNDDDRWPWLARLRGGTTGIRLDRRRLLGVEAWISGSVAPFRGRHVRLPRSRSRKAHPNERRTARVTSWAPRWWRASSRRSNAPASTRQTS